MNVKNVNPSVFFLKLFLLLLSIKVCYRQKQFNSHLKRKNKPVFFFFFHKGETNSVIHSYSNQIVSKWPPIEYASISLCIKHLSNVFGIFVSYFIKSVDLFFFFFIIKMVLKTLLKDVIPLQIFMKHEHFYNFYIQVPQRYVHTGAGSEIFLIQ